MYSGLDQLNGALCFYYMQQSVAAGLANIGMEIVGPAASVAEPIVARAKT